jgi:hypothetical protein
MLGDVDIAISVGAVAIVCIGLTAMNKAFSGAFLKARTIGRARAEAEPGYRLRSMRARSMKQPKTLADVALPHAESCAGAGRPDHGPLVYYGLRFLPEESANLLDEFEKLQPDRPPRGEDLAVFSALDGDARDAGAKRLSKRMRAAAVTNGNVDAFPLACCFPVTRVSSEPEASS